MAALPLPLYLGLGIISLAAARDPVPPPGVVWGIVVVWSGLFAVLVVNLVAGDEPWTALVAFRMVFDPGMALALGGTQLFRSD